MNRNAIGILPLFALAAIAGAQSQSIDCADLRDPAPAAAAKAPDKLAGRNSTPVAAQIQPRRPAPGGPSSWCRCGIVDAGALTAKSKSQEVRVLDAIPGTFRFEHVLLRETTRFASDMAGALSVSMGRTNSGGDVTSPFALRSPMAPNSSWYERPVPPQLTGAYDLVLFFQASFPLGDGATSNLNSGAVTWEVCGFTGAARTAR